MAKGVYARGKRGSYNTGKSKKTGESGRAPTATRGDFATSTKANGKKRRGG